MDRFYSRQKSSPWIPSNRSSPVQNTTSPPPPPHPWPAAGTTTITERPGSSLSNASNSTSTSSRSQFFRANDLKVKPQVKVAYKKASSVQQPTQQTLKKRESQEFSNSISSPRLKHRPSGEFPAKPRIPNHSYSTPASPQLLQSPRIPNAPVTPTMNTDKYKSQVARLDRKVMDLEISNTSLLAVNKYLEKKLRNISLKGGDANEVNEGNEEDNEEIMTSVRDLLISEGELDADAIDEKADLIKDRMSNHISFLETSQQIDKSIQNCLSMSELLIDSATEALNYVVNPEDVRIGGKIAVNDDDDDDDDDTDN